MSKVLVIEADPGLNFVMCETLRGAGHEPAPCAPEEAVAQAVAISADAIVAALSSMAPEQAPLYQALRGDPRTKNLPLVIITGRGYETVRRRLGEKPPFLLFKPFTPEELAAAVRQALA